MCWVPRGPFCSASVFITQKLLLKCMGGGVVVTPVRRVPTGKVPRLAPSLALSFVTLRGEHLGDESGQRHGKQTIAADPMRLQTGMTLTPPGQYSSRS
jgi:hypothetical protein